MALPRRTAAPASPISIGDAELVARARTGDRWAEEALFRRHGRSVAGLVARLLGSAQDVEDLVHDVFVSALVQLPRLREPAAFRAWLGQIAITHVRSALRKRRLLRALGLVPAHDDAALELLASSSIDPETRAELAVVDGVLRRLSANERIAWMLRYVEGHRLEEVAELCRCSLATTKRRLAAADRAMSSVIDVEVER
ncbi:MAG: RNA polymerase sigma factor [Sandaracinaceae bacterium]|nr:RNA polymerase sigma factor [Sandaracinaceae bacterium]